MEQHGGDPQVNVLCSALCLSAAAMHQAAKMQVMELPWLEITIDSEQKNEHTADLGEHKLVMVDPCASTLSEIISGSSLSPNMSLMAVVDSEFNRMDAANRR